MPNKHNIAQVKDISQKLTNSKSVIIASFQNLSSADQTALRVKVRQAGGEMNITKNTLIRVALQQRIGEVPQSMIEALNGPTAILYGYDDAVAATKALVEFTKEHEQVTVKAGILSGDADNTDRVLTVSEVQALAKLPSKLELISQLISRLNSPLTGFVNVLNGPSRNLVYVLNAIKDQKSKAN